MGKDSDIHTLATNQGTAVSSTFPLVASLFPPSASGGSGEPRRSQAQGHFSKRVNKSDMSHVALQVPKVIWRTPPDRNFGMGVSFIEGTLAALVSLFLNKAGKDSITPEA